MKGLDRVHLATVPRRTSAYGFPLCRWDGDCPAAGTNVGLCAPHWGAWRDGARPGASQLSMEVAS